MYRFINHHFKPLSPIQNSMEDNDEYNDDDDDDSDYNTDNDGADV